jgi:hypothetical protein
LVGGIRGVITTAPKSKPRLSQQTLFVLQQMDATVKKDDERWEKN